MSEALQAPIAPADVAGELETQSHLVAGGAEIAEIDLTKVYTRVHGDRVYSGTITDIANGGCPAFANMPLEAVRYTLENEDIAARMMQRGREKREALHAAKAADKASPAERPSIAKSSEKSERVSSAANDGQEVGASEDNAVVPVSAAKQEAGAVNAVVRNEATASIGNHIESQVRHRIEAVARPVMDAMVTTTVFGHKQELREPAQSEPAVDRAAHPGLPSIAEAPNVLQLPQVAAEYAMQQADQFVAGPQEHIERLAMPTVDFVEQPMVTHKNVEVVDFSELRTEIAELYALDVVEGVSEDVEASAANDLEQSNLEAVESTTEQPAEEIFASEVIELRQQLVALTEALTEVEEGSGLALVQGTERLLAAGELQEDVVASDPVELRPEDIIPIRRATASTPESVRSSEPVTAPSGGVRLEIGTPMQGQPLEVTFAHVARFLKAEDAGDNMGANVQEYPAVPELIEAVANLKDAYTEHADEPQLADRLSPRLVSELVKLMSVLGYEQPQEVLAAFAEQHGVQSLLEMIEYLCQLSHHETRKEFAPSVGPWSFGGIITSDGPDKTVLARALFWLTRRLVVSPFGGMSA